MFRFEFFLKKRLDTVPGVVRTGVQPPARYQRSDAKMKLVGANTFDRATSLVNAFAGMYGMASSDVDNLWRSANAL
jgi:hypothetical protein